MLSGDETWCSIVRSEKLPRIGENHIGARSGNITTAVYIQYGYDKEKRPASSYGARR